ncbi:MAG TPA: hypothetical protein VM942_10560 [Acidimicrobiales bacterium]|nr:hypothetical protein [Acidimicrobiales bacterium]
MRRIVTGGRARWAVGGAMAVVLLIACGDDGDDASTSPPAPTTIFVLAGLSDQGDDNIVVTEFLPEAASIVAGSAVEWRFAGQERHSVTFFPAGQSPPVPGTLEAQALSGPSTPPPTEHVASAVVNSGLLPADPATPQSSFRLTFPNAGEFGYVCVIHPNMTGRITVVDPIGAVVDTQADINTRADRELNEWLEEGRAAKKKLTDAVPKQVKNEETGATTWTYETGASTEHTDVVAFAPGEGEVRPGDSVTFVNNSLSRHTATFVGPDQVPRNPTEPAVATPSGPQPVAILPGGPPANSGILAAASPPSAPPPEPARSFTFVLPEPGDFQFACAFHARSRMRGSVKVA